MIRLNVLHDIICDYFGIDKRLLFSRTRKQHIVYARMKFYYLAYLFNEGKMSQSEIGAYYYEKSGNKWDHSTVVHATKVVTNFVELYPKYAAEIEDLMLICSAFIDDVPRNL